MRKGRAHRAEQHAGESATPMAADHHELRMLGFLDKPVGRPIAVESPLYSHIGIFPLHTRQAFVQDLRAFGFIFAPIHAEDREDRDITPRM